MSNSNLIRCALVLCLLLGTVACNDEDVNGPDPAVKPTLANIFPHQDGNEWVYDFSYEEHPGADITAGPVPVVPTLEALHADLAIPLPTEPEQLFDGVYRLSLAGQITTDSGVTAQRVRNTLYGPVSKLKGAATPRSYELSEPLLRTIARARPDLRGRIADLIGSEDKSEDSPPTAPILLPGYAFAFEDSGYYGYGDLDRNHSWTYLSDSLDIGTEFTLQLIPALATDVWLTGRVWSRGDLTVGGTTYRNVVECMYLVDMGESTATDENGDVLGIVHNYLYGTIHYAPEVGPIMLRQRSISGPDNALTDSGGIITDHVLALIGAKAE